MIWKQNSYLIISIRISEGRKSLVQIVKYYVYIVTSKVLKIVGIKNAKQ